MRILNISSKVLPGIFLFTCFFSLTTFAQKIWTLRQCIEYAKENSLTLKQAEYGIQLAALTRAQNKAARLPSLNGSASGGMQFGRTIDPTTNSFNNQRISFNSYRLDASVPLFSGGAINNRIRQSELDLKAAKADAAFAFNNTALNIANAFLQILMAEEQLENARKRIELTRQQLEQTDKMIAAGTLPPNDRLEVEAQLARDEQVIVQAENLVQLNYLSLKEFMQLPPGTDMKIARPQLDLNDVTDPATVSFSRVYSVALSTQPQVQRDEMRLKSSEVGVDIARAALMPTLTLFGGLDTRWSSASRVVTGFQTERAQQNFYFPNQPDPVTIEFDVQSPVLEKNPFPDQLDQNLGQSVGLALNVPIYNNNRNKINVERARVGILNAKLQSDLTKQQLQVDVQNAIANARAAHRNWVAAVKTMEAARAAFENAEKRYNIGAISSFQYTQARNTYDMAQIDLVVAKYDYVFRSKIIDYYLGRQIEIK